MNWISVKDQLPILKPRNSPEYPEPNLLVTDGKRIDLAYYNEHGFNEVGNAIWGRILEGPITHWLPIPELPC